MLIAACGGADDAEPVDGTASASAATRSSTVVDTSGAATTPTIEPSPTQDLPERIVALSEEFLLADLLSLGVRPVASTSNGTDGFLGIDPAATDGIEPIASPEFNVERLAALRPDLIMVYPSYVALDLVSLDDLEQIAPTVVIGEEGDDWRTTFRATAAALGLEERAEDVLADVDADIAAAAAQLDGVELSVASVSPGPLIRAFTDERTLLTELLAESGVRFRPDATTPGADDNGRVTLSLEQLTLLDGDAFLLLQSSAVPGEDDALAEVQSQGLWSALPAVAADRVIVLDRLGYPGVTGAARFVTDLAKGLRQ
jgi:iron complex transport system substrate-binding protein